MKKTVTTVATTPYAYITKGKQRVKQFDQTVYLQNGDEFEIELFNPTRNKVLAKIEINGNPIGSSGIVLRPGERVFLERYLNDAKKFLFETYNVSGENSDVEHAIKNNGDIVVKFYQEYIETPIRNINVWKQPIWYGTNTPVYGSATFTTSNSDSLSFTTTSMDSVSSNTAYFNSPISKMKTLRSSEPKPQELTKEIETGRIEKGSNSNQSFTYDYSTFNSWSISESVWKILPASQKPIMKEDLVLHCTECGRKRKKENFKYCPFCGNKY